MPIAKFVPLNCGIAVYGDENKERKFKKQTLDNGAVCVIIE